MKKALLLMLTLLTLGFAAAPVSAQTVWDGTTADISWYDASQTEFDISTPEQLAGVAALMTAQTTNFSGKTLNLTADIWLNADNDSTNNWTPIGGYASATSEDSYSTSAYGFAGTFKGHGHYIYNMYCEKTNYYQAGLFGCVQYPCTIDSVIMVNPIVKARGMSGSLIGYTLNSGSVYVNSCLIINCRVEATGNNNNGGLLGANWKMQDGSNWTYLTNCGVTGHVYGKYIGGVVGNGQKINATNVYFAGTLTPVQDSGTDKYGGILGHADASKHSFTHAYSNISSTYSSGRDGVVLDLSVMQTADFVDSLGSAFMMDNGMNNGYPILSCMAGISASALEICAGESVTLNGVGYDSYLWTPGNSTSQSITVSPTTTTTYTMTGSTLSGTTGTHTVTITVYPQAVVTATVATSPDGQVHATVSPETTTVPCGSSDNVTLTVTPDEHWRVASVYMNGTQLYEAQTYGPFTFTVNPGGTLANVVINMTDALTCTNVLNLAASNIFGSNATISWNAHTTGDLSEYHIIVRDVAAETETEYTTTDLSYVIMGLTENTAYQVGVYTFCLDGYGSDTAYVSFMTPCNSPVNIPVGDGTATNSYLPTYIYYGNTYSQQILPASVIGSEAMVFSSLSFKDNYSSVTTRACDIYLVSLPAGMNLSNGWILPDSANGIVFEQVFSGDIEFGGNQWVEVLFDTPFSYDGINNVMFVMNDHTNSWTSTHNYAVHEDATTQSMARYAYRDGTPYDAFNPGVTGTVLNVVDNIKLGFCDESTCIRPNTVTASNVTENSADIAWVSVGSESSWEVEYKADADTEWTSAGTFYTAEASLTGLDGNTQYSVHVRALCGGSDMSLWSDAVSFRTDCAPIVQLPYSENFDDANAIYSTSQDNYYLCWDRYASDPAHFVYVSGSSSYAHSGSHFLDFHHTNSCYNIAIMPPMDPSISISDLMISFYACRTGSSGYLEVGVMSDKTDPTTFVVMDTIDLSSYNTYEYGLQQVSFENYMDNGQYVAFRVSNAVNCGYYVDDVLLEERPMCLYPTNFHATNIGNEDVTLAWTEPGNATAWNILYDTTGFDPETEGTVVYADANPFTVTGLQNVTVYDFYVQADCGGMTSDWVGPVTVKTGIYNMGVTGSDTLTTCGMYIYDDGGESGNYSLNCNYTLVIYPETAGSGLSISGTVNTYSNYSSYNGTVTIYGGVGTSGTVLGSYTGNHTVNLAYGGPVTIHFTTGSYYNYAGFELLVQCTDCFPPSNLTVSNQTLDGATLSWSGSADSYEVLLGGAMTETYTTTDTFYTFTGLMSSSSYTVKVRGICGTEYSLYSPTANFNTACGAITITADNPWFEDFEGYTGGGAQSFVCWETPITEVVDNGTSPFVYCGHSPSCHSGANSAELKGTSNMVVLPEFSNDIQDLRLSFWATTTNTSNYGTVEVGYITDIFDPTTFVALGPAGVPGPRGSSGSGHGNYMGPFDFNGVTATSARMAIKFTGYSGLSWNLDDFTVELAPNCPSPVKTSVTATDVDGHNATISFTDDDPDHNSWTVYYKPTADSVWTPVVTSSTTTTLTNLDPQTAYDVYVVTNCTTPDAEEDATLTIHFTTTVACPAPQSLTVSNIDMASATVTWSSNADSFTIEYGEAGFAVGTGTTATSTTNSYDLTGLTSGTTYTVYVTADCGVDGSSTAASVNFNTTICAAADQCAYTFTLNDSYGDGWNGGTLAVKQNGITVATLGLSSGSTATETVNLCHGINTELVWAAGSYASEASFTLTDPDGAQLYASPTMNNYTTYSFQPNCSGCPMPTALTATNIGLSSATISWTGSADSYTVEYGEAGFTPGTGTSTTTTSTTIDLTGLTSATSYTVYITSDCGSGSTSSAAALNFATTICNASDQCSYTFVLGDSYGDGWNGGSLDVLQNGILVTTLQAVSHGGGNTQSYDTVTALLCDDISTSLVWNSGSFDSEVSFIVYNANDSLIFTSTTISAGTVTTFTTDCSGSGPGPVITDPTVATQAATAITQTGATLNGTITNPDNVTITAKGFEWMPLSGSDFTPVTVTGNNLTYDLSGLTANTDYVFKAFIAFNGTTVYGNEMFFTTLPEDTPEPCNVPTGLHTTDIQNESISIAWDANADVNTWNIQYKPVGGQLASASSNTNNYTITGLTGNTDYEIQVQAVCANGTSDWTSVLAVHTTDVGIESWLANSVTLYPNPAKEYVDIHVDGDLNVTMMEVYDVYGKLINTVNVVENPTRINVSNLANGMYFVRVTTEAGMVTKTFVKK